MLAASWITEHVDGHWVELLSRILGLLLVAYAAEVVLTTVIEHWGSMQ